MAKMMADYQKLGAPGPEHQKLATLAGTWVNHLKMWMGPEAQPMETPVGTHTGEMILGGRFLRFTETGEMMPGMTMEGVGILGFDKTKQLYTLLWIDNSATSMYTAAGDGGRRGEDDHAAGQGRQSDDEREEQGREVHLPFRKPG